MTELTAERIHDQPAVVMFTAPNPSTKTLSGTHSYVVGRDGAYTIDPGPAIPSYQKDLARWLDREGWQSRAILLTHSHPDHAPGARLLADLAGIPVLAPEGMEDWEARELGVDGRFDSGDEFDVGEDTLRVVPTPGHTPDHVGFWLEHARIFFAGDTILGKGTTLISPPEGDMLVYMRTLEEIRTLDPALIAPGHGPMVTNPRGTIDTYLRHRHQREQQLLRALASKSATINELVARVYTDVDDSLKELAHGSVAAQLIKLEREGQVRREGQRYVYEGD